MVKKYLNFKSAASQPSKHYCCPHLIPPRLPPPTPLAFSFCPGFQLTTHWTPGTSNKQILEQISKTLI